MPECTCSLRACEDPRQAQGRPRMLYAIIGSSLPDPSRARPASQQPPENVVVMLAPPELTAVPRHASFTLLQSPPAPL